MQSFTAKLQAQRALSAAEKPIPASPSTPQVLPPVGTPSLFTKPNAYVIVHRTHLACEITLEFNDEASTVVLVVEEMPYLNLEMELLVSYSDDLTWSKSARQSRFALQLPRDANFGCIQRHDHDTKIGALLEIIIGRKQAPSPKVLQGNRFSRISSYCRTKTPLLHEEEQEQNTDRHENIEEGEDKADQ